MNDENPFVKYRHVGFSAEKFIEMTRQYPRNFIMYCEVVVTKNGLVFLASPSHAQVEEWLSKKKFKNCCSVWYGVSQCKGELTKAQKDVLEKLLSANLINAFSAYCLWNEERLGVFPRWQ